MNLIKKILEKWACKHDWKLENERDVESDFSTYTCYTYICKKCGKFKRWKSH